MIQKLSSLLQKANRSRPIAKLPADILIDIFQTTCKSTQNTNNPITPLLFGGICKDWREIAWSTPLLWSTVSIEVSKNPAQVVLLREWLLRAQPSPLSIFCTLDEECVWNHAPFRAIFELLLTRVEYWQTFDCILPDVAEYHDMLQHREFPSLTSLSLRSTKRYDSAFPTMFLIAPRLVRVEFSGFNLSGCNLETFPLEQLRCLKLMEQSAVTHVQSLALLRRGRALEEYHIDKIYPADPTPSPTLHTELELLHLESLSLGSFFFFENLMLPKLRVLTIGNAHIGNVHIYVRSLYTTISSFIFRSSCQLEQLNLLQDFPFEEDVIITFLEALPSLTHLYLACPLVFSGPGPSHGLSNKFVSRLRPSQHGSYLLPRLTSLEYQGPVPCDNRLLVNMLAERWYCVPESDTGQRLAKVEIITVGESDEDLPQDVRADMDMLVSEGMQLAYKLVRETVVSPQGR